MFKRVCVWKCAYKFMSVYAPIDRYTQKIHDNINVYEYLNVYVFVDIRDLMSLSPVESRGHYCDVIMGTIASQINSPTIVYSTVHSGADQRKHQRSASLAFVRGIHRWPVNFSHKWSVTRKMFPFWWHDHVNSLRPSNAYMHNGLSPGRHKAIIWTNAGILLIGPLGTILIGIQTFSFKKMHLKMSPAKWRQFVSASMS